MPTKKTLWKYPQIIFTLDSLKITPAYPRAEMATDLITNLKI